MFDRLIEFLNEAGYLGIAALMFLENVFPPIPSEIIMPAAGFGAGQGRLSLFGVIVAGTSGSVAGALFWYYVGKWIDADRLRRWAARHGRWLTLAPRDIDRVDRWFDRHSGKAVLLGRLVPALRTLISVPAGVFGMSLPRFRCSRRLAPLYLNPITNIIVGLVVAAYLYRVATWRAT
ncbi:DedA family protein [Sphingomonas yabuuchiae]|uniref:DedA family protein n=1 Tax=Sphingomonas yabuuchiae TaxID=172044 RepID=UPI00337366DA